MFAYRNIDIKWEENFTFLWISSGFLKTKERGGSNRSVSKYGITKMMCT